jgi:hypothetical protein
MAVVAANPWSINAMGTCVPLGFFTISPSDTDELPVVIRQIEATGAGNVVVVCVDGTTYTLPFSAGQIRTGFFKQVKSTSTTATGLIAGK